MRNSFISKVYVLTQVKEGDDEENTPKDFTISIKDLKYKVTSTLQEAETYIKENLFYDNDTESRYKFTDRQKIGRRFIGERLICICAITSISQRKLLNLSLSLNCDRMRSNSQVKDVFNIKNTDIKILDSGELLLFPFSLPLEDASYQ